MKLDFKVGFIVCATTDLLLMLVWVVGYFYPNITSVVYLLKISMCRGIRKDVVVKRYIHARRREGPWGCNSRVHP